MSLKAILRSWDIWAAFVTAVIAWFVLPREVKSDLVINLYNVGISVLSIIFSVFFAALAIIISSGDNDFIQYLEETGDYSIIISSFRSALIILFLALVYSILIYAATAIASASGTLGQNSLWFTLFVFLFMYGLAATGLSSLDALKYAAFRVRFLQAIHMKKTPHIRDADFGDSETPRKRLG